MARKKASEQGDTLGDILTSAFALFGRYGYDGVSLGKVAGAANITKAAVYWHFESKHDLYIACLHELYTLFRAHILEALREQPAPALQVLGLFEGTAALIRHPRIQGGVAGYWLEASTEDLTRAHEVRERFEAEARTLLEAVFEQGMESGAFKSGLPVEDLAVAMISLIEASVLPLRTKSVEQTRRLLGALAHTFCLAHVTDPALAQRALRL